MPDTFSIAMVPSGIVVLLGILGCVSPRRVENLVKIQAVGKAGVGEIRATYGGIFLAFGIGLFYFNDPKVYTVAALTWFGAAALRTVSVLIDRNREKDTVIAIAFETVMGILFLFH
jgi:Domain of unknown function (DUF4345)